MNSPDPRYSDELDTLIQETLNVKIKSHAPSGRVWRRVKWAVQEKSQPNPRYLPSFRFSTMAQLAFLLLVLFIGRVDIQPVTLFQADSGISPLLMSQYIVVTPIAIEPGDLAVEVFTVSVFSLSSDRVEIQALKNNVQQIQRERNSLRVDNNTPPLAVPPTDVFPHSDSPASRVLSASFPQPVVFFEVLFFPQRGEPGLGIIQ